MPNIVYHPTSILLLEDEPDFAASIRDYLLSHQAPHVARDFIHPDKVIEIFNRHTGRKNLIQSLKRTLNETDHTVSQELLRIIPKYILGQLRNPERFNLPTTLVVDYEMPAMQGLKVCQKIEDSFIQKILLTGIADEAVAVQAFNKSWIHQYLRKQDLQFLRHTKEAIFDSQNKYFKEFSESLMNVLMLSSETCPVNHSAFKDLFQKLCDQYNIIEYYLFSPSGSFIMLDAEGNHYDLFVFSKSNLEETIEYAKDVQAPRDLLHGLKNYETALCFFSLEDQVLTDDYSQWESYLQPIQSIEGLNGYYYACVPNLVDIPRESYISFNEYMSHEKPQSRFTDNRSQ